MKYLKMVFICILLLGSIVVGLLAYNHSVKTSRPIISNPKDAQTYADSAFTYFCRQYHLDKSHYAEPEVISPGNAGFGFSYQNKNPKITQYPESGVTIWLDEYGAVVDTD